MKKYPSMTYIIITSMNKSTIIRQHTLIVFLLLLIKIELPLIFIYYWNTVICVSTKYLLAIAFLKEEGNFKFLFMYLYTTFSKVTNKIIWYTQFWAQVKHQMLALVDGGLMTKKTSRAYWNYCQWLINKTMSNKCKWYGIFFFNG